MRRLFTTEAARQLGLTSASLRWGVRTGRWQRIERGVYGEGPEAPIPIDRARAAVLLSGGVACGRLAGVLHELDGVTFAGPEMTVPPGRSARRAGVHRRRLALAGVVSVDEIACTDVHQTLVDLAATLSDDQWEQALECALRRQATSIAALKDTLDQLCGSRIKGTARIRRVLARRPPSVPPTESMLETLMVQLIRTLPGVPDPRRQFVVVDAQGAFVARLDLAFAEIGLFFELDGEHHAGQPVYDATRETAVVAATGWLCGRFTWTEVVRLPRSTARRVTALVEQAQCRPLAS